MNRYEGPERRRAPRFRLRAELTVATRTEQVVRGGEAVDGSAVGILVAFPALALPVSLGDRCLVSVHLGDRVLHVMGEVRRKEAGDDGRYYVVIEYPRLPEAELAHLQSGAPS
jgi:hypothetical protein